MARFDGVYALSTKEICELRRFVDDDAPLEMPSENNNVLLNELIKEIEKGVDNMDDIFAEFEGRVIEIHEKILNTFEACSEQL